VDIPERHALQDDGDQDDEEDGEEDGLVVEHPDGLGCGADAAEPVELPHRIAGFLGLQAGAGE